MTFLNKIKGLFTTPKDVFYSDLSPLHKAWLALWERPRGNHQQAVGMNEETIRKINAETKALLEQCRNKVPEDKETKEMVKRLATEEEFKTIAHAGISLAIGTPTIRRAVAYNNCQWPKQLSSGIMFFEGQRITIEEFNKEAKLFKGES